MRFRPGAVALVVALLAAACADDASTATPPASDPPAEPSADSSTLPPAALDATVRVTAATTSPIAAEIDIEASRPVRARITATSDDHQVATPVTAAAAASHQLPLVGLRAGRTYDLAVTLTPEDGGEPTTITDEFTTGDFELGLPDFDLIVDHERAQPGVTILELNPAAAVLTGEGNPIIGLDHEGEIVWFHNSGAFTGAVRRTPSGTLLAQNFPFGMTEFDLLGDELRTWYADPTGTATTATDAADGTVQIPYHLDGIDLENVHHDVFPMEDGSFLGLSATVHPLTDEQRAIAGCVGDDNEWGALSDVILQMDPDGTILRSWDMWDLISFEDHPGHFLCGQGGINISPTVRDWTHVNAMVYDPRREAVVVSVRHTDQIIALPVTDATGPQTDVRWILGADGTIPYEGTPFHHTHGVSVLDDGDILAYDNGNFRPGTVEAGGTDPMYSRALRIEVDDSGDDPAAWTARQVWEDRGDDPLTGAPMYSALVSDADELPNGDILITHGALAGDFFHVRVMEVVPTGAEGGDVVYDLRIGDADNPTTMYRADRWESLYFGPLWAEEAP